MPRKLRQIYMDYAATTPVDSRVIKVMQKYANLNFGNPSSIHSLGVFARHAVEDARKKIASVLNCQSNEIVFTSGGTEGNNLAVFGVARSVGSDLFRVQVSRSLQCEDKYQPKADQPRADKNKVGHIITSAIEHQSVLAPCRVLEQEGFEVTYLPVSQDGFVNPEDVKKALRPNTFLVSIMYANNEIGTIQPINEIAKVIRRFRSNSTNYSPARMTIRSGGLQTTNFPLFHIDACQAPGALSLNVSRLGIDLMTLCGSKIYGPKGVGCLYVKNGFDIAPLIYGGGQERGLRSGTENVASIVGFASALSLVDAVRMEESERLGRLRDYFIKNLLRVVPETEVNGFIDNRLPNMEHRNKRCQTPFIHNRLPNNVNVFIPGIENEQLVIEFDAIGVAISSGSACNSNEDNNSHVISALGYGKDRALGSVRFSLGRSTTKKDIDYVIKFLPEITKRCDGRKTGDYL